MRRRFEYKDRELEDFLIRFYPAGNYTWIVPEGCFSVDVFLVGGGGSAGSSSYTQDGASDGGDTNGEEYGVIKGQGHTTRDFGESGGKRNAGGGSGETNTVIRYSKEEYLITVKDLAQGDQQTDLVKEEEVMAAEEAASDTLWFMPEPAVMVLC